MLAKSGGGDAFSSRMVKLFLFDAGTQVNGLNVGGFALSLWGCKAGGLCGGVMFVAKYIQQLFSEGWRFAP